MRSLVSASLQTMWEGLEWGQAESRTGGLEAPGFNQRNSISTY